MQIDNESLLLEEEGPDEIFQIYEDHKSVKSIYSNKEQDVLFSFNEVPVSKVKFLIQAIDHRKACGFDDMPPKLLKSAANELAPAVTIFVNKSVSLSHFPCEVKKSELSPIFKDKDDLLTQNSRSLSVLTSLSKFLKSCITNSQMLILRKSVSLSAFQKHYGCEHILAKLIEDCKHALDEKQNCGLILLDLSKALDYLPHRVLLCTLRAYRASYASCKLINSCLFNHLQRVKVSSINKKWMDSYAKRSTTGLSAWAGFINIFLSDIFYRFKNVSSLYNYADNNTISCYSHDMNVFQEQLEANANLALDWFAENQMRANPSNFHPIIFRHQSYEAICELNTSNETKKWNLYSLSNIRGYPRWQIMLRWPYFTFVRENCPPNKCLP